MSLLLLFVLPVQVDFVFKFKLKSISDVCERARTAEVDNGEPRMAFSDSWCSHDLQLCRSISCSLQCFWAIKLNLHVTAEVHNQYDLLWFWKVIVNNYDNLLAAIIYMPRGRRLSTTSMAIIRVDLLFIAMSCYPIRCILDSLILFSVVQDWDILLHHMTMDRTIAM